MKTVKERDDLDLLTLVCELHARSMAAGTKVLHDASVEAREELESRLKAYNGIKNERDCFNCRHDGQQVMYPGGCTGCNHNGHLKNWKAKIKP